MAQHTSSSRLSRHASGVPRPESWLTSSHKLSHQSEGFREGSDVLVWENTAGLFLIVKEVVFTSSDVHNMYIVVGRYLPVSREAVPVCIAD